MLYQVRVSTKDVKYLRFLGWPGGDMEKAPEEFQMLVHLFGKVSSPSCASYALGRTTEIPFRRLEEISTWMIV